MAAVGPPPGLGHPQPPHTDASSPGKLPTSDHAVHAGGRLTAGTGPRYSKALLLKLASSPLVPGKPADMPPLAQWFGDWEPYTPKPHHNQHHQYHQHGGAGGSTGPTGGFVQNSRGNREGGSRHHHQRPEEGAMGEFKSEGSGQMHQGSGYLPGFQGVRRREGEREPRYRKNEDREGREYADSTGRFGANGGHSSRFPTGKNPFGQVSASGTFKPAGKDGDGSGQGRFPMGRMSSYNREDDAAGHGRLPRTGGATGRRRNQAEEVEEESADWETVPRSPEAERKLARQMGGLADSAADWRRGPGAAGPPPGLAKRGGADGQRGGRTRGDDSRRAGPSGSFPAWMVDDSEPSWMNDEGASSPAPLTSLGEKRERGKLNFDAFKTSENFHATPREGEDSIQAFKREMKERERRAAGRSASEEVGNETVPGTSTPPGLSKASLRTSQAPDADGEDHLGDSARTEVKASKGQEDHDEAPSRSAAASSAVTPVVQDASAAAPAGSARGTSRFARFFDGTTATNKAKEAQERALAAMQAQHSQAEVAQGTSASSNAKADAPTAGGGLEMMLRNMGIKAPGDSPSSGGNNAIRQPSEADVEGMQKIMAMLRGGGGGGAGNAGQDSQHKGEGASSEASAGAAGLMAMLAGAASAGNAASSSPRNPEALMRGPTNDHSVSTMSVGGERPSSPQQPRLSSQSGPPGLDAARFASRARASPGPTGRASPAPGTVAGRSQSPSIAFHHLQHPQSEPQFGPPPQFAGSPSSPAPHPGRPPMPPFVGMDPRTMGNRPPPPGLGGGGVPPSFPGMHGAHGPSGAPSAMSPRSNLGPGAQGPSGANGLLAGLPPHVQQQLIGLPPHVQHSILTNGGPMPPPLPGHLGPHQQFRGGQPGFSPMPPPPPGFMPSGAGGSPAMGFPQQRPFPGNAPQHVGPYAQQAQQPQQQQQSGGPSTPAMMHIHGLMYGQQG
ncbi:unnamed protein product [Parajaminaea phylloscopi]